MFFEKLSQLTIICMFIALLGGPISLFAMRLYYVLKNKIKGNVAASILVLPLSLGLFYYHPEKSNFKIAYKIVSAFFFACIFLGTLFIFYQYII